MTKNDWVVLLPFVGSVAVTVIVDVWFWVAWVVSMMSTPLGLVDVSVAELIVIGLTGCRWFSRRGVVHDRDSGHLVDGIHTGEQLAEDRIAVSQARVLICERDEELRGVAVGLTLELAIASW